jgi:hypothetical protein
MGTRSLTYVYNGETPIVCMYRQFDGYPTGHGLELAEFLNKGRLVNGLNIRDKSVVFNGMGCLAAQIIAHFKQSPGGFYIHSVDMNQDCWQEYEYHVYESRVVITEPNQTGIIFDGTWKEFENFCSPDKDEKPAFDTKEGKDWLLSLLKENTVTVTFDKTDGTERVMKCTLQDDSIKPNPSGLKARPGRKHNPDVCSVWDIESDGWRSFRFDSIKKVEATL